MISRMTLAELGTTLDWAAAEGWNPGQDDAAAFLATDPDGFFMAKRDGVPVAAISVVNHAPDFAFLGLYLCHPDWRGQGIAHDLWTHALAHAGPRTVGLDGVTAQQTNYARSGFRPVGETLVLRGTLPVGGGPARLARPDDLAQMLALDLQATGHHRTRFLTSWTSASPSRKTVVLADSGGVIGFATARLCRTGCKIGPVIAPDTEVAMRLIHGAAAQFGATDLSLAVPAVNTGLYTRLVALGFTELFRTARMYRGPAPLGAAGLQVAATLELG
jgi:GNAT superfamily N-acetyltransferase